MENSSQSLIPSASMDSVLPDVISQPPCMMRSTQGHSQSHFTSFHGLDIQLTPKTYNELSEEDCYFMVSESIKSIIVNTFNDEFRRECFELLKVNTSEEVGVQITSLLGKIDSDKPSTVNKNNRSSQLSSVSVDTSLNDFSTTSNILNMTASDENNPPNNFLDEPEATPVSGVSPELADELEIDGLRKNNDEENQNKRSSQESELRVRGALQEIQNMVATVASDTTITTAFTSTTREYLLQSFQAIRKYK